MRYCVQICIIETPSSELLCNSPSPQGEGKNRHIKLMCLFFYLTKDMSIYFSRGIKEASISEAEMLKLSSM